MVVALGAALLAAVAYGIGSVLQEIAASREEDRRPRGFDPGLLVRLAGSGLYVGGVALDGVGFALTVVALRRLPLFVVEATVASSIGVTALLAWRLGLARLHRGEVIALSGVGVGLLLLASSAESRPAVPLGPLGRVVLVALLPALALIAVITGRHTSALRAGVVGGVLAGAAFAGTAIAARGLKVPHHIWRLLEDPVALALVGYGLLGMLLFATALQRGSVTTVTAALFAVQTVVPAIVGVLLLGDRARSGWAWAGVLGFVVTVAGALELARVAGPAPLHEPPSAIADTASDPG